MAVYEKNGIVYELNYNTKTGIVKYSDSKLQEAKILGVVNGCNITEIASKAFYYCENLKSVIIPESIVKIKNEAFLGCKKLETINFNNTLKVDNIGIRAFCNCFNLKYLVLENVKTIAKEAFANCTNLMQLKILGSYIEILEEDIFIRCERLQTFEIVSSIKKIKSCFKGCESLKNIIVCNDSLDLREGLIGVNKNVLILGNANAKASEMMYYGFMYQTR